MSLTKANMEYAHQQYHAFITNAEEAERQGLYKEAVTQAKSAWEHVDGFMQFEKKYGQGQVSRLRAIELVLKLAPLLLDYRTLEALAEVLANCKRIGRTLIDDPAEKLAAARERLKSNHRLWTYIEASGAVKQAKLAEVLGGEQEYWRSVAQAWSQMGLVNREEEGISYQVSLTTRLGQVVSGKCPSCGKVADAPKSMFFEPVECQRCRKQVLYVILSPAA